METRTLKSKIGIYMLLSVLAVLVVIPFGWMLLASVKTSNEVFSIPMKLFPKEFQWVNYQTIWDKIPLLVFFKNTFKIAVCTTLLQVLTSCFAAYGFPRWSLREGISCSWYRSPPLQCPGRHIWCLSLPLFPGWALRIPIWG